MARLIDADKLIELLNKKYSGDENINESVLYLVGAISGAPTVDAVEVVRCGECRYYRNGGCLTGRYDLKNNDFCSWGEKI